MTKKTKQIKIDTSGELMFMTEGESVTYRMENLNDDNRFVMVIHLKATEETVDSPNIIMLDNAKVSIVLEYDCEIEEEPISA